MEIQYADTANYEIPDFVRAVTQLYQMDWYNVFCIVQAIPLI